MPTFAHFWKISRNYFDVDSKRPEMSIAGNMQPWFHNRWQKILISGGGAAVISIAGGAEEKQQSRLHRIIQNFALSTIMICQIRIDHTNILNLVCK